MSCWKESGLEPKFAPSHLQQRGRALAHGAEAVKEAGKAVRTPFSRGAHC